MRPIILQGHERAITQIKYNREGDFIFSCSKDNEPNVWLSINGERKGSFVGHNGALYGIDVSWDSLTVLTASADSTAKLWDCERGLVKETFINKTAIRTCSFSYSGNLVMITTDKVMGHDCELRIYDLRSLGTSLDPISTIAMNDEDLKKVTAASWGLLDTYIVSGHDDGSVVKWDMRTNGIECRSNDHKKSISDLQVSLDETMFITSSKDTSARLFSMKDLSCFKTYKTERPVNSAAISPTRPHVLLGGGEEAVTVTQTASKLGSFEAKFFHLIFEEEFGRVSDHFGPINTVAYHPDGNSYASGGEDGFVRVHAFDKDYLKFNIEY